MTAEQRTQPSITARPNQPLVGVFATDGSGLVRYFIDDQTDPPTARLAALQAARAVIGAWSDLDWGEFVDELDRMRHAHPPTLPINLDDLLEDQTP